MASTAATTAVKKRATAPLAPRVSPAIRISQYLAKSPPRQGTRPGPVGALRPADGLGPPALVRGVRGLGRGFLTVIRCIVAGTLLPLTIRDGLVASQQAGPATRDRAQGKRQGGACCHCSARMTLDAPGNGRWVHDGVTPVIHSHRLRKEFGAQSVSGARDRVHVKVKALHRLALPVSGRGSHPSYEPLHLPRRWTSTS